MAEIRTLSTSDSGFDQQLGQLLAWEAVSDGKVQEVVAAIIADVRTRGDAALLEYTGRFDGWEAESVAAMEIASPRLEQAWNGLPEEKRSALQHAAERIRSYAKRQKMESWNYTEDDGTVLGQQVTPLD
ncbi:MAG: histidinol dehydrogenase, partial [Gammaproteobacteria bacterium]|nr:histidinol dehydrogenase [Gammaproteobacteria bacterium]